MWAKRGLVLWLCLFSYGAFANALFPLFEKHFHEKYEPRYCGKNAQRFIEALQSAGEDLTRFYLVMIENKGGSVFGMLNAERARGWRFDKPAEEEVNWYHHVFVLDDRGMVYDFDFTVTPQILPIGDYLEAMFLKENNPQRFKVGRQKKLEHYELASVAASEIVNQDVPQLKTSIPLKDVVKNWKVLLASAVPESCHLVLARWQRPIWDLFH